MGNKTITLSREEYTGRSNKRAKAINTDISDLTISTNNAIKALEEELEAIQKNCIHQYKLYSTTGPYSDWYKCSLCGHDKN